MGSIGTQLGDAESSDADVDGGTDPGCGVLCCGLCGSTVVPSEDAGEASSVEGGIFDAGAGADGDAELPCGMAFAAASSRPNRMRARRAQSSWASWCGRRAAPTNEGPRRSSQRDAQGADIAVEKYELADNPHAELRELAMIYEKRGLDPGLARQVAVQLTEHGELEAHVRDELGVTERTRARPVQAALVSAVSFGLMSLIPVASLLLAPRSYRVLAIATCALASLGALGALGGHLAGAPRGRAALRVLLGRGLAMATSALIGRLLRVAGV
ncbi:MAG: VIT1/CCC1 transporter family protein [Polyangiaceae bacterium]